MRFLNFLIEKRAMFLGLLLLLFSVTFVSGDIVFHEPTGVSRIPSIAGWVNYNPGPIVKRTEITSGKVEWPKGRRIGVDIETYADGVGVGQGTLTNLVVLDKEPLPTYQGNEIDVWAKKEDNGEWERGTAVLVRARYVDEVPDDVKAKKYKWESGGDVTLTPWVWEETVGNAVTIRWPVGAQGTFTTTGRWIKDKTTTTRSARKAEGTHHVAHRYYCEVCGEEGDTPEAIGGKEKHKKVECPECGDKYHVCDKTAVHKHSEDPDTGKYRCDPLRISLNKTDSWLVRSLSLV